jgi:hypothetical protein
VQAIARYLSNHQRTSAKPTKMLIDFIRQGKDRVLGRRRFPERPGDH